ncbi:hypothetical protein D3C76_1322710 [compost metagenome]
MDRYNLTSREWMLLPSSRFGEPETKGVPPASLDFARVYSTLPAFLLQINEYEAETLFYVNGTEFDIHWHLSD